MDSDKYPQNKAKSIFLIVVMLMLIAVVITVISQSVWAFTAGNLENREQVIQYREFLEGGYEEAHEIQHAWFAMRIGYAPFIDECESGKPISSQKLKAYRNQQEKLIDNVQNSMIGMRHYFGNSIEKIFAFDLKWYQDHAGICPQKNLKNENANLENRQNALITLLLNKLYDPRRDNKNFDNPYFMSES